MAFNELHFQINALISNVENVLQAIIGRKYYTQAKLYALRHPFIFAASLAIAICSAVPLLFFLGFVIVTLAIALLCFFCIEGSLIAISGLIFVGVISFIAVIVGSILSGFAAAYWVMKKLRTCARSCSFPVVNLDNNVQDNDSSESSEASSQ